jgi:hypothetical protein
MRKTLFSLAFLLVSFDYTTTWYQIYPDEIQKPFIYRQLIPTLTSLLPLGEVMSLVVIEILICIATGLLMLYAYEKMWKVSGANDVLLLFCFYLVVTVLNFSFPWKKSYDAPTAFFFLLMFILWREKKYALSIPVFALACLNRETAILIVPVLFLMRRRWALHIYQVVIFIGIRYILVQVFSDYDGTAVWIRPIENFLMHMENIGKTLLMVLVAGFILYRFYKNVSLLKRDVVIFVVLLFPILLAEYIIVGYPFEIRVFAEVSPLLLMGAFLRGEG